MVALGFATMTIEIRLCTVLDVVDASTYGALIAAYAQESALDDMPAPQPDVAQYLALEQQNALVVVGAFEGDTLVGFMACALNYAPQYGAFVGMTMVLFVGKAHRKHGTGSRLVALMEDEARKRGAVGIVIGAPSDSRLAKAAPLLGFRETNRLYFKAVR